MKAEVGEIMSKVGSTGPYCLIIIVSYWIWTKWKAGKEEGTLLGYYWVGMVINTMINLVLKGWMRMPRPGESEKMWELWMREGKRVGWDRFGMPSGHGQMIGYTWGMMYEPWKRGWMRRRSEGKGKGNWKKEEKMEGRWMVWMVVLIGMITMIERVVDRQHTAMQVIVGWIVGIIWGKVVFGWWEESIRKKKED